ncbi:MAG: MFS transporter [Rhodocyclaceae bacterium]|nr:MAG: MFS transporter [Rhodocyclaceae bacterium]
MSKPFLHCLANNMLANIVNFTVWFALTFWIFLETKSVFATGMVAGIYLVLTALFAIWFGSLVDHHRKKRVMLGSSLASIALYAAALAMVLLVPRDRMHDVSSPYLWAFVLIAMLGVIAGNLRNIALPTLVTALIAADRRDRANGLVGMVTGVGFVVTSAISGLLVAWGGMIATLVFALGLSVVAVAHLITIPLVEPPVASGDHPHRKVDIAGTIRVIGTIPGLFALIVFSAFNNFLGGVFMALMDAYGLSLMSVEAWGALWAFLSCAFILSGIVIARTGLGRNPLKTLMLVNLVVWLVSAVFTIQSSIPLLAAGCFIWLFLGPYAEAAEQTTLQQVVPYDRQGRVFGFAQSVEQAASPLVAFLIGPLTQFLFIPLMTTGAGAETIGSWYGTGPERGIALVFTIAGLLGALATLLAFNSRYYRMLSVTYAGGRHGACSAQEQRVRGAIAGE